MEIPEEITETYLRSLSNKERAKIPKDIWHKIPPKEKKSCGDCHYLISALSWWCSNKKAIKAHGSSIPGGCLCKFWEEAVFTKWDGIRLFIVIMMFGGMVVSIAALVMALLK